MIRIERSPRAAAAIEQLKDRRSGHSGDLVAAGALGILATIPWDELASLSLGSIRIAARAAEFAQRIRWQRAPSTVLRARRPRLVAIRPREHRAGRARLRRGPPSDDPDPDPEPPRLCGRVEVAR
jgi:hypothetical protein